MTQFRRRSPAVRLLDRILTDGEMSPAALERALGISSAALSEYRGGLKPIPVAVRLRLTEVVLHRLPQYARPARQLRAAIDAELEFAKTTTVVHMTAPPSRFGP
jgi:hypothetical protein